MIFFLTVAGNAVHLGADIGGGAFFTVALHTAGIGRAGALEFRVFGFRVAVQDLHRFGGDIGRQPFAAVAAEFGEW